MTSEQNWERWTHPVLADIWSLTHIFIDTSLASTTIEHHSARACWISWKYDERVGELHYVQASDEHRITTNLNPLVISCQIWDPVLLRRSLISKPFLLDPQRIGLVAVGRIKMVGTASRWKTKEINRLYTRFYQFQCRLNWKSREYNIV